MASRSPYLSLSKATRGGIKEIEYNFVYFLARMTFKMYAVDFCELLLYDEQKQAYHMTHYAFNKKNALDAIIK